MQKLKKARAAAAAIVVSAIIPSLTYSASAQSSQTVDAQSSRKIYGYQDPVTGEFHAMKQAAKPDASAEPTTGTVEVTLNITLKTAVPKGGSVICNSTLGVEKVFSNGVVDGFNESAAVLATVSGSTATCTMTIPYSWTIATGTALSQQFSGGYSVEILKENGAEPGVVRSSSGTYVAATTVPASGTTSKYTEAVTL